MLQRAILAFLDETEIHLKGFEDTLSTLQLYYVNEVAGRGNQVKSRLDRRNKCLGVAQGDLSILQSWGHKCFPPTPRIVV